MSVAFRVEPQRWRTAAGVLALVGLAASVPSCSGDGGTGTVDEPPTITINGVTDGLVTAGAVTITIAVDRGSYEALLNGASFFSGTTIEAPGGYALEVTARAGTATSTATVDFQIILGGSSVTIVRLFDLGANDAGGGGDAILVTDSSGAGLRHALIDAGPAGVGASDPGFVARRLAALGVDSLAFIVLTHAHGDHFAGLPAVLYGLPVGQFYYNGQVRAFAEYNDVITLANQRAGMVIVPASVIEFAIGLDTSQTFVSILPPLPDSLDQDAGSSALNNGSIGVRLRRGGFEAFFTGDGEVQANLRWRTQFAAYTANVEFLKVGHHGANDAMFDNGCCGSSTWLAHTAPILAALSANGTTHPRASAVSRLRQEPGLRTYCTNVHGTIELRVNPAGRHQLEVERGAGDDCQAGIEPNE